MKPAPARGLDHPVRRQIYAHLLLIPGNHLRAVIRELDLGSGAALHHLRVLERHGLVRRENGGTRTRYYPLPADGAQRRMNELQRQRWAQQDLRRRLEAAVAQMDDVRPVTIGRALGISRQLAAYHLARLDGNARRPAKEGRRVKDRSKSDINQ